MTTDACLHPDPDLPRTLAELMRLEACLQRPEPGCTRANFERLIDPAFREVGASGLCYSREAVLDALERRLAESPAEEWQADDGHCQELAQGVFLLTYFFRQGARTTRRASLWRQTALGWTILYHQGTVVE